MMKDLDSWIANLYFELEKVNIRDIKVQENIRSNDFKLYYKPVRGVSAQEQQQFMKMH